MNDILALLQPIQNSVSKTTFRQLGRIILAMIAMTGRVTHAWAVSLDRERRQLPNHPAFFLHGHTLGAGILGLLLVSICWISKTPTCWPAMSVWSRKQVKQTHGLDYFFSGLLKKAVPGLSFFTLALISVKQRRSYPVCMEQTVRTEEEKAASQAKKQAKKAKPEGSKRKLGRPKGSRNKNKAEVSAQSRVAAHPEDAAEHFSTPSGVRST